MPRNRRILLGVFLGFLSGVARGGADYDYFCGSLREQFTLKAALQFAPDKAGTTHVRLNLAGVSLGSAVGGMQRQSGFGRYNQLYSLKSNLPARGNESVPMIREGSLPGEAEQAEKEQYLEDLRGRLRRPPAPMGVDQAHGPIEGTIGLGSFPAGKEGHFEGETLWGYKASNVEEAAKRNHMILKWSFDVENGQFKNVRYRMVMRSQKDGKTTDTAIRCGEGNSGVNAGFSGPVVKLDCD